ncbi:hypothetical protein D3C87_1969760 [compost metagenome]
MKPLGERQKRLHEEQGRSGKTDRKQPERQTEQPRRERNPRRKRNPHQHQQKRENEEQAETPGMTEVTPCTTFRDDTGRSRKA